MHAYNSLSNTSSTVPQEHHWHIMFDCSYSKEVWKEILNWCGIRRTPMTSVNEWMWIFRFFKGNSLRKSVCKVALAATIYHLWTERNHRVFRDKMRPPSETIRCIIRDVRLRFKGLQLRLDDNDDNRHASMVMQVHVTFRDKGSTQCSWLKPPLGWIALNSDGSLTDNGRKIGGLLKDEDGNVMLAYNSGSNGATIGFIELEAIAKGIIQLAVLVGVKRLLLQTDSSQAARYINKLCPSTWRTKRLMSTIFGLKNSFEELMRPRV
ncbi:Ribonuclease h domain [Thalictrum thalictroides]|uniref:Ribonuclease h domain n=1 Tax=Thalictrum thalictroides TaxID=46969 RepID=A0A7J6VPZ4_THATH|nr:Ribonuclease h domain [Thalictrum thalictroides]